MSSTEVSSVTSSVASRSSLHNEGEDAIGNKHSPHMLTRDGGAFDRLVQQNMQLNKEDKLSAEEVTKEIRKAARNPNGGSEPPPKEEPFDLKGFLASTRSSRQSSQPGSTERLSQEADT